MINDDLLENDVVTLDVVTKYAKEIVEGQIIAGQKVILACKRHLNDLNRQNTDDFPYVWDYEKAEKVFKFFGFLKHVEGEFAGQIIKLADFQAFIIGSIFGWVHKDTRKRRFRKSYVQVARKAGKSLMEGGTGLYMQTGDGEYGAQIFSAATKREQAQLVYNIAKNMVYQSPELRKRLKPTRDAITYKEKNSKFIALAKDTKSLDGFNPHLGIIDEYHAHTTSEMYDVLVSGMGQRSQPLLMIITTAGFDLNSPCYKEYEYLSGVLEGIYKNENYFIYIAELDEDDDIKDESTWIKANPILNTTPQMMDFLRQQLQEALDKPELMRSFLTKNMNKWVDMNDIAGYIPLNKWRKCFSSNMPDTRGQQVYIGVDLSAKLDLTSLSFEFKIDDKYIVFSHSFMPQEKLEEKRKKDKVPYDLWVKQGWITTTPRAVIDYRFVKQYMLDEVKKNDWIIKEICIDPWNSSQFITELDNYTTVEIQQILNVLSLPTKDFREQVYMGNVIHIGNPVLEWAINNAVLKIDQNENIQLDKKKARERIDPIAAVINAHTRCMEANQNNYEFYVM